MTFFLLLLYLFLVIIRPQEYMEYFVGTPILIIVLAGAFISWVSSDYRVPKFPQIKLFPLLIIIMMASISINGWVGASLFYLTKMTPIFVMFLIITSVVDSNKKMENLFKLFVLTVVIICVHGVLQRESGIGWTGAKLSQGVRITYLGIFNDPNDLAMLMIMVLPFSLYLSLITKNLVLKLFWFFSALLIVYAVYLTQSRGGMLAFVGILSGYLVVKKGMFFALSRLAIFVPMLGLVANRMTNIDASEGSASGRIEAWYEAFHMFISNPFWGIGPGQFTEYHNLTAHNSFFLILAELGFIGYFLWLTFLIMSLLMAYRCVRYFLIDEFDLKFYIQTKNKEFLLSLAIFLSCVSFIVTAFFLSRSYNIMLFIICALCISIYNINIRLYPSMKENTILLRYYPYFFLSLGSIVSLYLLVVVLLRLK